MPTTLRNPETDRLIDDLRSRDGSLLSREAYVEGIIKRIHAARIRKAAKARKASRS